MSLAERILVVVKQKGEASLSDLYNAIPDHPRHSVRSKASVLAKKGVLRKMGRGVFALPEDDTAAGTSTAAEDTRPAEEDTGSRPAADTGSGTGAGARKDTGGTAGGKDTGSSWADQITAAIQEGCTTYSCLCDRFGEDKAHIIRSVISKLKKKGVVTSPRPGMYLLAHEVPAREELVAVYDLADLSPEDLVALASMMPGRSAARGDLPVKAVKELKNRGFVTVTRTRVTLTPKGVHVAAFIRSYINLLRRGGCNPSEEDVLAESYRLASLLETVQEKKDEILSTLSRMTLAAESISNSLGRLISITPAESRENRG